MEEISQVHPQDDLPAYVRCDEGFDGVRFAKSVRRRMGRNSLQDIGENPALKLFQTGFGRFNEAKSA